MKKMGQHTGWNNIVALEDTIALSDSYLYAYYSSHFPGPPKQDKMLHPVCGKFTTTLTIGTITKTTTKTTTTITMTQTSTTTISTTSKPRKKALLANKGLFAVLGGSTIWVLVLFWSLAP